MTKLKAFSLVVLFNIITLGFVSQSNAQAASGKFTNADRISKITKDLSLDKKQVAKLTSIYKDQDEKLADLKKSGLDKPSQVIKRRDIWKSTDSQIEAMLTPEQKPKWEGVKAELKSLEKPKPQVAPKPVE